jgi:hypothetical protein
MLRACVRAWGQVLIPLKLMEALQHNDGPEVTSLFEAGIVTFRSVRMRKKCGAFLLLLFSFALCFVLGLSWQMIFSRMKLRRSNNGRFFLSLRTRRSGSATTSARRATQTAWVDTAPEAGPSVAGAVTSPTPQL